MGTTKCCCYLVIGIIIVGALANLQWEGSWGQPQEDNLWDSWWSYDDTGEQEDTNASMNSAALSATPNLAGTTLIDGIFNIVAPSDAKTWDLEFQEGQVVKVTIGYFSLGKVMLCMLVESMAIDFMVFNKQFSQGPIAGTAEQWRFAVPLSGAHHFNLSLLEPVNFSISVYVKIEIGGIMSNPHTAYAGESGTPLCWPTIFTSDNECPSRMNQVILDPETIYWFSAASLTPFDHRYAEQAEVQVWAYLEDETTGDRYAVAAGGSLDNDVLEWHSTWFAVSAPGLYRLNVTITANQTFRVGLGFTLAEYRAYGNFSPDDSQESQSDSTPNNTTPNPFLSMENLIVLIAVVGGIIVVAVLVGIFSRHSPNRAEADATR